MKNSRGDKTTAQNLEEKFDRGEDVLDYFDLSKARVVHPQPKNPARKKLAYSVKDDSHLRATVREKSARYPKKK
jgi:hypothetical protein